MKLAGRHQYAVSVDIDVVSWVEHSPCKLGVAWLVTSMVLADTGETSRKSKHTSTFTPTSPLFLLTLFFGCVFNARAPICMFSMTAASRTHPLTMRPAQLFFIARAAKLSPTSAHRSEPLPSTTNTCVPLKIISSGSRKTAS